MLQVRCSECSFIPQSITIDSHFVGKKDSSETKVKKLPKRRKRVSDGGFGDRLLGLMEQRSLSFGQLGSIMGYHPASIRNWTGSYWKKAVGKAIRKPSEKSLIGLATVFNVDVEWLRTGVGEMLIHTPPINPTN